MQSDRAESTEEEITPAMVEAGFRAFICDCGALIHREEAVRIYRAMRAARIAGLSDLDGEWAE